jgi:ketosteroid isomerase-like protein
VSQENVETVRRGYAEFLKTGTFVRENFASDFVWDMSHYDGWPEQQVYEGVEAAQRFMQEWTSAWVDWDLQIDKLLDAGDKVVAVARQRGRSKLTGIPVEVLFAKVWTLRGGKNTRMDMYSNVGDALTAAGLREG